MADAMPFDDDDDDDGLITSEIDHLFSSVDFNRRRESIHQQTEGRRDLLQP